MSTGWTLKGLARSRIAKAGLASVLAAAACVYWYMNSAATAPAGGAPSASGQAAPAWDVVLRGAMDEPAGAQRFETGLEELPRSLQGVDPPAGLIVDGAGNLVVRRSLRDFFDHFLSALGEEPLGTLRARVKAYMSKSLPAQAYQQALPIFDGYVGYRLALQSVPKAGGKPAEQLDLLAVALQKQQERTLRAQFLPVHVATAFFGDDDSYDNYTLARLRVERDSALSDAEKKVRVAELFAQLPVDTQASIQSLQALQEVERIDALCMQERCTADQLYQQRAALVGVPAAKRLQALDEERAAWTARVNTYLAQRTLILGDDALTESVKQAQIQRLKQGGFSEEEQLRLPAFEAERPR